MKITQNDRKEIIAAIQSGKTTKELASKYGVSSFLIGQVYREATGKGVIRIGKLSLGDRAAIVTELQSGNVTTEDLAIKYGVHRDTISRNFRQMTEKSLRPRQLSQIDKEEIVAALQAGTATMKELANTHGVTHSRISQVYKEVTGSALWPRRTAETALQIQEQKNMLPVVSTLQERQYRAWSKRGRKMYDVWGIDWLYEKIQIQMSGFAEWQSASTFILMGYSRLRDKKLAPEHPDGQKIYAGDIVQFPINFTDGRKEKVKDVVAIDPTTGGYVVVSLDNGDPLCLHHDECEVIGTIQENPELLGSELQKMHKLLKKYTFA